jgi:CheY-like chemotaxis protein
MDLLQSGARQKQLGLALDYPAKAPRCFLGDANRIRQIVVNLVGNAIKYTDSGSIALHVAVKNRGGLEDVTVSVVDTGIGIAEETQALLFQEFSQLDSRSSRKYGGTGLGLAISKKLAELMGGEVGVKSRLGGGSTFWFRLPLSLAAGAPDASLGAAERILPSLNLHVLVVEDNAVNRRVAVAFLGKLGCTVETAEDGNDAVRIWSAGAYDIILMDCQMPDLDGYGATKEIRMQERSGGRTPIIAMTAHALGGARDVCLAAGMDDYISKPIDFFELVRLMERWAPAEPLCYAGCAIASDPPTAAAAPPISLNE